MLSYQENGITVSFENNIQEMILRQAISRDGTFNDYAHFCLVYANKNYKSIPDSLEQRVSLMMSICDLFSRKDIYLENDKLISMGACDPYTSTFFESFGRWDLYGWEVVNSGYYVFGLIHRRAVRLSDGMLFNTIERKEDIKIERETSNYKRAWEFPEVQEFLATVRDRFLEPDNE